MWLKYWNSIKVFVIFIEKLKKHLKTILFLFLSSRFLGQVPSYYQSVNLNLTGDLLKNELSNLIINTHQNLIPYTSSTLDTWDVIKSSDIFSLDTSKVMLVYGYNDNDAIVNPEKYEPQSPIRILEG